MLASEPPARYATFVFSLSPALSCRVPSLNRYQRMYLHVDMADPAATGLYSSMGYKGMEQFDAPAWMRRLLKMPTIRYQVKEFKGRRGAD